MRSGGFVRLAEDEKGAPIGFCWGFWGFERGRLHLHSRMVGVMPTFRGRGVAVALKREQREFVLARGGDEIRWTFDPLVARNAALNFGILGVESATYLPDLYGSRENEIQRGLPTDRLEVSWRIASPHAAARSSGREAGPTAAALDSVAPAVLRALPPVEAPRPTIPTGPVDPDELRIEIPPEIAKLRDRDLALAREWRLSVRAAMASHLARGFKVVDFGLAAPGEPRAGTYLLRRSA